MKNSKLIIVFTSTALLLSGCNTKKNNSSSEKEKETFQTTVDVKMGASLNESKSDYNLSFKYDDAYFAKDAKAYDKELSLLSFGNSLVTASEEAGRAFYDTLQFKDFASYHYDVTPTKDTAGYFFAHRSIDDAELFAVSFRGFDYGEEWANNFIIGKTGDHNGFSLRANEAYEDLQSYISSYRQNRTVKLWINGYSRGGALSNTLASLILREDKVSVTEENLFVYTFEAPASLTTEHAVAYQNVHNIINKNDLVTNIPPLKYGLKRCGVDYEIYDSNYASIMKDFDKGIVIPEFVNIDAGGDEPLSNDEQVLNYILKNIFDVNGIDEEYSANDRDHYVDNYQQGLSNMIGYIFKMKPATRNAFISTLQSMGISAVSILGDSTGVSLRDFIAPYLTQDGIAYDDDALLADCAVLVKAIGNLFLAPLMIMMSGTYSGDFTRLLDMHYPESTYALLLNAHSK